MEVSAAKDDQHEESRERTLSVALRYTRRGWSVIPIPHRSKNPGFFVWQELRLSEADLVEHFNAEPQNIGVLLGEPSGGLVDVDLDHPRAVELAEQYLPPTPAVFGRKGNSVSIRVSQTAHPQQVGFWPRDQVTEVPRNAKEPR